MKLGLVGELGQILEKGFDASWRGRIGDGVLDSPALVLTADSNRLIPSPEFDGVHGRDRQTGEQATISGGWFVSLKGSLKQSDVGADSRRDQQEHEIVSKRHDLTCCFITAIWGTAGGGAVC